MLFKIPVLGTQRASYSVQDIRTLQSNLKAIEPDLRSQFVKEIKKVGKAAESPIKSALRQVKPLTGMTEHYGVTSWLNVSR